MMNHVMQMMKHVTVMKIKGFYVDFALGTVLMPIASKQGIHQLLKKFVQQSETKLIFQVSHNFWTSWGIRSTDNAEKSAESISAPDPSFVVELLGRNGAENGCLVQ